MSDTLSLTHDGRLRAHLRAMADDLRALERELSGLRLPDSALRQVCRRDEHHARELLRNPRTRYGQSQRSCP